MARHPHGMLMRGEWGSGDALVLVTQFRAPLIACGVTLGLVLAARVLRLSWLAAGAAGAGVLVGWYAVLNGLWLAPHGLAERLPLLAAGALLLGLAALRLAPQRGWLWLGLAALTAAWWLAGAPQSRTVLLAAWPVELGVAAAVLLVGKPSVLAPAAAPLRLGIAGLALAIGLRLTGAPPPWFALALAAGLAGLPLVASPRLAALALLALATDIAATAAGVDLAAGRLPHRGVAALDVAAGAPLLVLWLSPALAPRLSRLGDAAGPAAALLAGAVAVGLVWGALQLGLR